MPRKKRQYIPKVKGCYECSQRRVDCDRATPSCTKCKTRGIRCSGLGIRYRFREEVNQGIQKDSNSEDEHDAAVDLTPRPAWWHDYENMLIVSPSEVMESWKLYCLTYYSTYIASELVVVNDSTNGWRHLVLPIAHTDELVRQAVLSAATFHFSTNVDDVSFDAAATYTNVVTKLRARQDLQNSDHAERQNVVLALLVLLSTMMVNGSEDFPAIYNLLESALTAIGGEKQLITNELGIFLDRQIRKFRGYAAPFHSRDAGVARLCITSTCGRISDGWGCFNSFYSRHPEFDREMSIIYELNNQACDLYVGRANETLDGDASIQSVTKFVRTLQKLPPGSTGEHVLVWSVFLAAAESVLPSHQQYLQNFLIRHYRRNGFTNILTAVHFLQSVWAGQIIDNWTEHLPKTKVFIV